MTINGILGIIDMLTLEYKGIKVCQISMENKFVFQRITRLFVLYPEDNFKVRYF